MAQLTETDPHTSKHVRPGSLHAREPAADTDAEAETAAEPVSQPQPYVHCCCGFTLEPFHGANLFDLKRKSKRKTQRQTLRILDRGARNHCTVASQEKTLQATAPWMSVWFPLKDPERGWCVSHRLGAAKQSAGRGCDPERGSAWDAVQCKCYLCRGSNLNAHSWAVSFVEEEEGDERDEGGRGWVPCADDKPWSHHLRGWNLFAGGWSSFWGRSTNPQPPKHPPNKGAHHPIHPRPTPQRWVGQMDVMKDLNCRLSVRRLSMRWPFTSGTQTWHLLQFIKWILEKNESWKKMGLGCEKGS